MTIEEAAEDLRDKLRGGHDTVRYQRLYAIGEPLDILSEAEGLLKIYGTIRYMRQEHGYREYYVDQTKLDAVLKPEDVEWRPSERNQYKLIRWERRNGEWKATSSARFIKAPPGFLEEA